MSDQSPPLLRPRPRRPFELTPLPSPINTPVRRQTPELHSFDEATDNTDNAPARTRSFLNLTTSTLFGIYSPADYQPDRDETPWGTGAQTPIDSRGMNMADISAANLDALMMTRSKKRRGSMLEASTSRLVNASKKLKKKKTFKSWLLPFVGRNLVLGIAGIVYGQLIAHLHDRVGSGAGAGAGAGIVPVRVEAMSAESWAYIAYWCFSGVALGQALPWVDGIWEGDDDSGEQSQHETTPEFRSANNNSTRNTQNWTPGWNEVVRFIGAAVGIAFAIRRLPWQSPLQLSLTLALANPTIWYLLDRTGPCFILATTVALSGTGLLLSINPDLIPSPCASVSPTSAFFSSAAADAAKNASMLAGDVGAASHGDLLVAGVFTSESVGVATWIASVLFVSAVAFGNIGRRLL